MRSYIGITTALLATLLISAHAAPALPRDAAPDANTAFTNPLKPRWKYPTSVSRPATKQFNPQPKARKTLKHRQVSQAASQVDAGYAPNGTDPSALNSTDPYDLYGPYDDVGMTDDSTALMQMEMAMAELMEEMDDIEDVQADEWDVLSSILAPNATGLAGNGTDMLGDEDDWIPEDDVDYGYGANGTDPFGDAGYVNGTDAFFDDGTGDGTDDTGDGTQPIGATNATTVRRRFAVS